MHRLAVIALFAVGCAGTIRFGRLDPPEGRWMVVDVDVTGNRDVGDRVIVDRIRTHSDNLGFGDVKPLLDASELPTDAQRIQAIYAARGYFQARVVGFDVERRHDGAAKVRFQVFEGRPTRVSTLDVIGLDAPDPDDAEAVRRMAKLRERMAARMPLARGDVWTEEAYEAAKTGLRNELRDRGFVHATVSGEVFVSRATEEATVRILADVGPLARVREVVVKGNRGVPTARILRRIDLKPGDILDARALRRNEAQVADLGVFFSVNADAVDDGRVLTDPTAEPGPRKGGDPDVTLEVSVQEMQLHEIRTGGGAEIDNQRSEARVLFGYNDRSFLGGLRYLDALVQPGVVFLPSFFVRDVISPGGTVEVVFRQPSFIEEYLMLTARAGYRLDVELGYRSHGISANLGLTRKFLGWLTAAAGFSADFYRFYDVSSALSIPSTKSLGLGFREQYLLTYFEESLGVDLRDSTFDARNGFFAMASAQESARWIGSDFSYVKLIGDVRGYWTPWRPLTLAVRFKYGQTFAAAGGDTPLPARFLGGGLSDHRGFAAQRMGPYLCRADDGTSVLKSSADPCAGGLDRRVVVGGDVELLASAELRWYLPASFGLVAFSDVGEIWSTAGDVDLAGLNVAVGPGLRYYTPFGPIRADFGLLLDGPRRPGLVFHFSIGQAF